MKQAGLILCGAALGAAGVVGWMYWYFRDVMR